jgi:hypothetical protein
MEVEQPYPARPYLPDVQPAGLAATADANKYEGAVLVEFAVPIGLDSVVLPGAEDVACS